jgi:hypothetical protein
MHNKKPRVQHVGLDFGKPTVITGIRQNADGSLTFLGENGEPVPLTGSVGGLAYARAKGPKITVQIPEEGESTGELRATLERFDQIVGVDTNSREHQGEVVCATVVSQLTDLRFEGEKWSAKVMPLWALEFRSPTKDPERIGWRHALGRGVELCWFHEGRRVLLVVDCHLEELHNINKRTSPLIDDFMLPTQVTLAYASSDTATDSPLNGVIAQCDRLARTVLAQAISPALKGELIEGASTPFRAHRYWRFGKGP